jgi:hypothetical protein
MMVKMVYKVQKVYEIAFHFQIAMISNDFKVTFKKTVFFVS